MYVYIVTESEENRLNCLEEGKKSICESQKRRDNSEDEGKLYPVIGSVCILISILS